MRTLACDVPAQIHNHDGSRPASAGRPAADRCVGGRMRFAHRRKTGGTPGCGARRADFPESRTVDPHPGPVTARSVGRDPAAIRRKIHQGTLDKIALEKRVMKLND